MAGVEEEPSQARRFPRTLEGSRREPASAERCGFVTEGETYNAARPADGRLPVPENLDGSALPHETGLQRLAAVTSRLAPKTARSRDCAVDDALVLWSASVEAPRDRKTEPALGTDAGSARVGRTDGSA